MNIFCLGCFFYYRKKTCKRLLYYSRGIRSKTEDILNIPEVYRRNIIYFESIRPVKLSQESSFEHAGHFLDQILSVLGKRVVEHVVGKDFDALHAFLVAFSFEAAMFQDAQDFEFVFAEVFAGDVVGALVHIGIVFVVTIHGIFVERGNGVFDETDAHQLVGIIVHFQDKDVGGHGDGFSDGHAARIQALDFRRQGAIGDGCLQKVLVFLPCGIVEPGRGQERFHGTNVFVHVGVGISSARHDI